MVCSRCKIVVKSIFESTGITPVSVELGEVELKNDIQESKKNELLKSLRAVGFDLIDDRKSKTIDKIKTLIIDLVQNKNNDLKINLSEFLFQHLHQDYNTLSNLFSEVENTTIEKYFIKINIFLNIKILIIIVTCFI